MPTFDGKLVSEPWFAVLTAAREDGVRFHVNSGRRTMTEQWALYRAYQRGGTLAAYPSPTAPHIREGRDDHALDVNALDGGAQRLDTWATAKGFPLDNTVVGEAWHKEIRGGEAALRRFAASLTGDPVIRKGTVNREAVTRLQRLLRSLHLTRVVNGHYGIWTRRAVRRFQQKHGLAVDGVVGAKTWQAIRRATHKGD